MTNPAKIMKLITELSPGDSFYTDQAPKVATRYSARYGIKIKTEVCLLIQGYGNSPKITRITKVTIV